MDEHDKQIQFVQTLFNMISDQTPSGITLSGTEVQKRVAIVAELEKILKDIHSTEELQNKVELFITKQQKLHLQLKKYRISMEYSERMMAELCGVSYKTYLQMEKGRKPLNKVALDYISD